LVVVGQSALSLRRFLSDGGGGDDANDEADEVFDGDKTDKREPTDRQSQYFLKQRQSRSDDS